MRDPWQAALRLALVSSGGGRGGDRAGGVVDERRGSPHPRVPRPQPVPRPGPGATAARLKTGIALWAGLDHKCPRVRVTRIERDNMLARVCSAAVNGIEAYPVEVEVNAGWGDTLIVIVGLPDAAVKESRDRVTTALHNSGFKFPMGRTTINLAPADVKKEGPSFDLPDRDRDAGRQRTDRDRPAREFRHRGRTGPDRRGAAVQGRAADRAPGQGRRQGRACWCPPTTRPKRRWWQGLQVIPVQNLREAAGFLEGEIQIAPTQVDIASDVRQAAATTRSGFRGCEGPGIGEARARDRGGRRRTTSC